MGMGTLKGSPGAGVATGAEFSDFGRASGGESEASEGRWESFTLIAEEGQRRIVLSVVDGMAGHTGDLDLGVRATDATGVSCLILMTAQATRVSFAGGGFGVVEDEFRFGRFAMFGARTVAGFAGLPLPTALGIGFDDAVAGLQFGLTHIFVADQTGFRAGIAFLVGVRLLWRGKHQRRQQHD